MYPLMLLCSCVEQQLQQQDGTPADPVAQAKLTDSDSLSFSCLSSV